VRDCGYQSQMAAEYAGKRALVAFLDALEKEEWRRMSAGKRRCNCELAHRWAPLNVFAVSGRWRGSF
jgi:hypothetical protein